MVYDVDALLAQLAYRPPSSKRRRTEPAADWAARLAETDVLAVWSERADGPCDLCGMSACGEAYGVTRGAALPEGIDAWAERGVEIVVGGEAAPAIVGARAPLDDLSLRPNMPFGRVSLEAACREMRIEGGASPAERLARVFVAGRYRLWW